MFPRNGITGVTLFHPVYLVVALLLTTGSFVLAYRRGTRLHARVWMPALAGMIALSLAAGGLGMRLRSDTTIVAVVDLSQSTRTAAFRDASWREARLREVLGFDPESTILLSGDQRTVFDPPASGAVVLFSDCQFDLPAICPPVYVIADPALQRARDAAVASLTAQDRVVTAVVRNDGDDRTLAWSVGDRAEAICPHGTTTQRVRAVRLGETVVARLNPADNWPENDTLVIAPAAPSNTQSWWIGAASPGGAWVHYRPDQLPVESSLYLAPSAIVLDNVPVGALSLTQLDRLAQYVRDLGGAVLINGGNEAFAAGQYTGTTIDALSPLQSDPPSASRNWIMLVDCSGSMSARVGSATRLELAANAARSVVPFLPPADSVAVYGFARQLTPWWTGRDPNESGTLPALEAGGPTNLEPALTELLRSLDSKLPTEVLIITDGQASVSDPAALLSLAAKLGTRLHLMCIGDSPPAEQVESLIRSSGGSTVTQSDAARWAEALRRLARGAAPAQLIESDATLDWRGPADSAPARAPAPLNRTWLKDGATALASASVGDDSLPMVARWNVGAGSVLAISFRAQPDDVRSLANQVAAPPRDPRFTVNVDQGSSVIVTVSAATAAGSINQLMIEAQLGAATPQVLRQTAPGRYELRLDPPRQPEILSVRHGGNTLDRVSVAARYPRELDAIGNNLENMKQLAARTGGKVIRADETGRVDLPLAFRMTNLSSVLAGLGALLVALSLVLWKRG